MDTITSLEEAFGTILALTTLFAFLFAIGLIILAIDASHEIRNQGVKPTVGRVAKALRRLFTQHGPARMAGDGAGLDHLEQVLVAPEGR